jgi:dephospho-CoA kinase
MKVLGITGGIGSGKSVFSKLLEINGIPVYNTDIASKRISDFSWNIREKLTGRFGPALYREGLLDRPLLASLIFNHPENRVFVNSVIHPEVENDFLEWKDEQTDKSWVGIESAILFEAQLCHVVDVIVNISAPLETRIRRVQQRDNLNRESVLNRIKNQISDGVRNYLADYTIINDDRQALAPQVENLMKVLKFQEIA